MKDERLYKLKVMDGKVKKDLWIKTDKWIQSAEEGSNQKLNNQM